MANTLEMEKQPNTETAHKNHQFFYAAFCQLGPTFIMSGVPDAVPSAAHIYLHKKAR